MKLYVVHSADFDDADYIVGVYTTQAQAEIIAEEHDACFWGGLFVEEMELDAPPIGHECRAKSSRER